MLAALVADHASELGGCPCQVGLGYKAVWMVGSQSLLLLANYLFYGQKRWLNVRSHGRRRASSRREFNVSGVVLA